MHARHGRDAHQGAAEALINAGILEESMGKIAAVDRCRVFITDETPQFIKYAVCARSLRPEARR